VHLRGRATKSCQVPVQNAAGAPVVTIEGLSPNGSHPLQQIWKELDVPDCGYCQGGQIMAAAALLATTPNPTDAQIDTAMSGNLCRCGTYLRIREGIHRATGNAANNGKGGGR
jgi:isoquinoline 1-oxidoreductase alpha subunit